MNRRRAFLQWWKTRQRVDVNEKPRASRVLYETAWVDAWPHVDDWFRAGAVLGGRVRVAPVIL